MRIVVHGQQAFGKAVLEKLLERGEDVVAVCCAPTKEGRPEDPLAAYAREQGLPVHQPASWKTPEALDLMKSFDADVCMMAYVLLFVPSTVLDAPRHGSFQYHPSLLPTAQKTGFVPNAGEILGQGSAGGGVQPEPGLP